MANPNKLSAAEARIARSFIHDLLVAAGHINYCKKYVAKDGTVYKPRHQGIDINSLQAGVIVDELINRSFTNINTEIERVTYQSFLVFQYGRGGAAWHWVNCGNAPTTAKYLVHYAMSEGLFWDDSLKSIYEIEEFEKTYLGAAVKELGAYLSNQAPAKAPKNKTNTNTNSTSNASGTKQPKDPYKSSGPQSSKVRDLKNPNKVYASATGNYIFKIEGINSKSAKVIPTAHIKPLKADGNTGSTNKVYFASANGYTDCTCYFDDIKDADAFLVKVMQNLPANITNPHVVKTKADPNGYFIVGTEYGDCAIAAKKLNEELDKSIQQTDEGYQPQDVETYLYDCLKYN